MNRWARFESKCFFWLASAFLLRLMLVWYGVGWRLQNRIEISTPFNAWKRVQEGLALKRVRISPYLGDTVHCNPLLLSFFELLDSFGATSVAVVFSLVDLLAALLLYQTALLHRHEAERREAQSSSEYASSAKEKLMLKQGQAEPISQQVLFCYLFNPVCILSSICLTLTTFSNLTLAFMTYTTVSGLALPCFVCIAFASINDVYSVVFVIPALLAFRKNGMLYCFGCLMVYLATVVSLLAMSSCVSGDWSFLDSTIGSQLDLSDMTPNVGLFWYFFVEIFDHYRWFFLCIFHLSSLSYALPLGYSMRDDPFMLCFIMLFVTSLFKSYPSIGDTAVHFSLIPAFSHLLIHVRYTFVVICMLTSCAALSPIMWHMWIELGSANANFFFAITLVYAVAQIFLMTGFVYAYYRRKFHFKHGIQMTDDDNEVLPVLE